MESDFRCFSIENPQYSIFNRIAPGLTLGRPRSNLEVVPRRPAVVAMFEMLFRPGRIKDLELKDRVIMTEAGAREIHPDAVVERGDRARERIPCDSVVLAMGSRTTQELNEDLKGIVPEIHVLGDAKSRRKALDASWEGYEVGLSL